MSMGVCHPGHQGGASTINKLCIGSLDGGTLARDLRNPVAPDQNLTGESCRTGSVNHVHIDEKCL